MGAATPDLIQVVTMECVREVGVGAILGWGYVVGELFV
jgi:hypothetical protein